MGVHSGDGVALLVFKVCIRLLGELYEAGLSGPKKDRVPCGSVRSRALLTAAAVVALLLLPVGINPRPVSFVLSRAPRRRALRGPGIARRCFRKRGNSVRGRTTPGELRNVALQSDLARGSSIRVVAATA